MHPDAASAAKRDATPLRLLSWLSFRLEPAVEALIEDTMLYLSTAEKVTKADLLSLGTKHLDKGCESVEALRDHLIELVSARNLKHRPEAPAISAEVNVASTMPFFGPGAAATDASTRSVG